MKKFQTHSNKLQKSFNAHRLPSLAAFGYALPATAKSVAERGNSFYISAMAHSSTPLDRAFFMRSVRTPQENASSGFLSMVARNGKGSPFAVFIAEQFSTPLRVTALTVESLAVISTKVFYRVTAMIYTFICVHRNQPTYTEKRISIEAPNLNEARWRLPADYRLILERPVARLPAGSRFADFYAKPTACTMGVANA